MNVTLPMCTRERTNEKKKSDDNRQRKHEKENDDKIENKRIKTPDIFIYISKITQPYLIRTKRQIMA